MSAGQHRTGTQAVERALDLLRAIELERSTLSLTELAERTGLSPSTAHRIIRALCGAGLVRQDIDTDRYGLGPQLVILGERAAASMGLEAAGPALRRLCEATGESVNLGVLDGNEVVVLACIRSTQRLRFDQEIGTRVPAYASAMGKALLAFAEGSPKSPDSLPHMARLTRSTITSRPALRRALDEVRRTGWALNDEEREPGVRTVAAPVLGADGVARAAIAVQGPTVRMVDDRLPRLASQVRDVAEEVAVHLTPAH